MGERDEDIETLFFRLVSFFTLARCKTLLEVGRREDRMWETTTGKC